MNSSLARSRGSVGEWLSRSQDLQPPRPPEKASLPGATSPAPCILESQQNQCSPSLVSLSTSLSWISLARYCCSPPIFLGSKSGFSVAVSFGVNNLNLQSLSFFPGIKMRLRASAGMMREGPPPWAPCGVRAGRRGVLGARGTSGSAGVPGRP